MTTGSSTAAKSPSRLRKKSRCRAICRAPMQNARLSCGEFVTETGFCVDFDAFCCRWADSGRVRPQLPHGTDQLGQANEIVGRGGKGEHPADAGQTTVTGLA